MLSLAVVCKWNPVVQTSGRGQGQGQGRGAGGASDFGSRIESTLRNVGSTLQQSASKIRECPTPDALLFTIALNHIPMHSLP